MNQVRRGNTGRWRRWGAGLVLAGLGAMLWVVWALSAIRVAAPAEGSPAALAARLTPAERAAIREGRVRFLDGATACRLAARRAAFPGTSAGGREVLVILNPPGVGDGQRVLAVTEAAARLGARLMVDCTDADLARLTPSGWRSVLLAKRAGIWRMVVFDGAHHLPALAADPELLLLPVLTAGRQPLVVHGYVRDALPLAALRRVLRATGREPVLLTIPRLSLPLKEHLPLRLVALQVLRRLAEADPPSPPEEPVRRSGRGRSLAGVVVKAGAAWLPGGIVLAAGRAGEAEQAVRRVPGGAAVRRAWVAVSYGNFGLFRPVPPLLHAEPRPDVTEVGWPVSVWDLLLRYPGALVGQPLPWSGVW